MVQTEAVGSGGGLAAFVVETEYAWKEAASVLWRSMIPGLFGLSRGQLGNNPKTSKARFAGITVGPHQHP